MEINKFVKITLVLLFFTGSFLPVTYAQNKSIIKGFAKKAATINVATQIERSDGKESSPVFKVPNPNMEEPEWKQDDKIIYQTNKPATVNAPNRVRSESPAPEKTFLGLLDNNNSIPPDVMGTAGPNHVMTTLNTQVRIHDRDGNEIFTTTLGLFWKTMPGHTRTFDPKITYDPYNDRWIFVTPSHPANELSKLYLAVSETSDPLGNWHMYWLNTDVTDITWFDFPTIGFNKNWIVVCGNQFGNDYYRTVFVYDKQAAYNGADELPYTRFATSDGFTLVPTFTYDTTLEKIYLIAADNGNDDMNMGNIKKFVIQGPVDEPELIYQGRIKVSDPWANWAGNAGNFLPQAGSQAKINSVDTRMVNTIYRNGKIWAVHHIFLPANNPHRTAVQWWVLDTSGVVLERGRIEDPSNEYHFAFPSIAVNRYEDMMIGHGVFSENQFASSGYSYKNHTDQPGTVRTFFQYKDGLAPYYKTYGGARNRWGDYSATSLDPVDQSDFWVIHEYAEVPANTWSTWWAYVKVAYKPIADFESDNVVVPTGEKINFKDLSKGIPNQWLWHFEGAEPEYSTDQNPVNIKYNTEGTFDVSLIVTNELGADTLLKEDYITVSSSILPEVNFSANQHAVCVGEPVTFTDSTLYMPVSWEWEFVPATVEFEEGTDQYSQNPVVTFNESGNYTVKLTASNINGASEITKFDFVKAGGFIPYFHENFENGFEKNYWSIEDVEPEDVYPRTWQRAETGYYSNNSAAIRFTDYIYWGHRDRLVTPAFNLEGMNNATLEFKHAYAKRFDDATDSLIVLLSEDCGNSWVRLAAYGDDGNGSFATSPQTDTTNYWKPMSAADWCGQGYGSDCKSINLNNWLGKSNIKIAFESFNFFGNTLYIDDVTVAQYTAVEEINKHKMLKVYPNPVKTFFTVKYDGDLHGEKLEVFNNLGKKVFYDSFSADEHIKSVDVKGWSKGVYIVKVGNSVEKIVLY